MKKIEDNIFLKETKLKNEEMKTIHWFLLSLFTRYNTKTSIDTETFKFFNFDIQNMKFNDVYTPEQLKNWWRLDI